MKVINLFSGPGAGKSTTRAGLFHLMKSDGKNVEEALEYAKDVTWEGTQVLLSDQLWVLANQNRRLERCRNKVEAVISDSPLLLTLQYQDLNYLPHTFKSMVHELWNTYDNFNVFVNRSKKYNPNGRNQTLEEAIEIDKRIKLMLDYHRIPYIEVEGNAKAPQIIYDEYKKVINEQ
jgi:hypothetical protein